MFEKNLEAIDNLALKRRLAKVSPIESRIGISYCVTPSNDYILLKDELPIDDLNNPREAVRQMLDKNIKRDMVSTDIIITFGIGLGYLLDEAFNKYPSKIYVYEPDLKLLHFVLNNVDISDHLSSGRVFITNDLEELTQKLSATFLTKDKVEIVYLKNYVVAKNTELLLLTQRVLDTCKSKIIDINTITKFSKRWLRNTLWNISMLQNKKDVYLLSDLENKFQGQTALIAGAGPSLNDNIEHIIANRSKFVIFAVNKSVKYLLSKGIKPDFVVCLDAKNMKETLKELDVHLADSNCIMDIRTDHGAMWRNFKKVFVNFGDTDFFIKKLDKYNKFMKYQDVGGSASTFALISAVKMGFSKILLSGVDLAFKDNIIYSDGEAMNRVSQEEIMVNNVKKNIVSVKSVKGDLVYTREDYQAFIHHFTVLIKELGYSEIYNTSSFGADIMGTKNVDFEAIDFTNNASLAPLAFVQPFKFELEEFVQKEFYNINQIITQLSKGVFSPALVNSIVNSAFVYQYMQAEVLEVLQSNFAPELAQGFIDKTKISIKKVVDLLQKTKLI